MDPGDFIDEVPADLGERPFSFGLVMFVMEQGITGRYSSFILEHLSHPHAPFGNTSLTEP